MASDHGIKWGFSSTTRTLGWFAMLTSAYFLFIEHDTGAFVSRIDRSPGEHDDEQRRSLGPSFMASSLDTSAADVDDIPLPPSVFSSVGSSAVSPAGSPAGTSADDVDGTGNSITSGNHDKPGKPQIVIPQARQPVLDPCIRGTEEQCEARAMDSFYAALSVVEQRTPGALVRISHYGDSIVAGGYVTTRLRRRFQTDFGDGGAGFVYFASPSRWYVFRGVRRSASKGWSVRSIGNKVELDDGLYGVGGTAFLSNGSGWRASFQTARKGMGSKVSSFELYYLAQPRGGAVELNVDGTVMATLDSSSPVKQSAFHRVEVPDGEHKLTVKLSRGGLRTYGVVMERDQGVVYDNMGVVGLSVQSLGRRMVADHWIEQVRHRGADLLLVMLGSNEAIWVPNGEKSLRKYHVAMMEVLRRLRAARPDASCLVVSPLDNAAEIDGTVKSRPVMPGLVKAQREAALARGCAFWDTHGFMGGVGSSLKWRRKGLVWMDFSHPTTKGGAIIADAFYEGLMAGYAAYKVRMQ